MRFIQHGHTARTYRQKYRQRQDRKHSNLLRCLCALMRKPSHARHHAHAYWHWIHWRPPLDCNALNFVLGNGYFSIQRSIVIDTEEEPIFALPYFMLSSPDWGEEGSYNAITQLHIAPHQLNFTFADEITAAQTQLHIHCTQPVNLQMVDFLVNEFVFGWCGGVCRWDGKWIACGASIVSRTFGLKLRILKMVFRAWKRPVNR